jgi:hypothetical protein
MTAFSALFLRGPMPPAPRVFLRQKSIGNRQFDRPEMVPSSFGVKIFLFLPIR